MARRWQAKIVALVSASAKAHAVEIDLLGEKVRSNPATGVRVPRGICSFLDLHTAVGSIPWAVRAT